MTCTQFSRAITLLRSIMDTLEEVTLSASTPKYNSVTTELYNSVAALTGVRPTTMADVSSALSTMSRDFYDYMQNVRILDRMGNVDYLLPTADLIFEDYRYSFAHKYLANRSLVSDNALQEAARILDHNPFRQGNIQTSDFVDRILMRHPDLTQTINGFVSVKPSYMFRFSTSSAERMQTIETIPTANKIAVCYASDDALYMVVRNTDNEFAENDKITVNLTAAADHFYFFGTVELVKNVDDRTIAIADKSTILSSTATNLPELSLDSNTNITVGTKEHFSFSLKESLAIRIPAGAAYPSTTRSFVIRLKGKFYLDRCGYAALQKSSNLQSGSPDSWNHELDSLRMNILTSSNNCSNDVNTVMTDHYAACLNTALRRMSTLRDKTPILIYDSFSNLGSTLSIIVRASDKVLGITPNQRQRLCMLATTLHIIFCVFLSWYTGV